MTRRVGLALAVVVASLVLTTGGVAGDAPTTVGWWTASNPGGSVPTIVPSRQARADVPAGGFEVATAPNPVSYAAVGYFGADGVQIQRLVLKLATDAAQLSGSKVQACPLTGVSPFASADGAPIADGPKYDCASAVPGIADSAGTTVTFDIARLARDTQLQVAIVGVSPSRLVFAKPDDSMVVVAGGAGPPGSDAAGVPVDSPAADSAPVGVAAPLTGSLGSVPASQSPDVVGPAVTPGAATSAAVGARPDVGGPAASFAVTERDASAGPGSAVVGFAIVLIAAAAVTARNRRVFDRMIGARGHTPATSIGG